MKLLFSLILLVTFPALSQVDVEAPESSYLLHQNELLTPGPTNLAEFREGLKAHNEKFHSDAGYAAQVYYISSGPNSGKYMSVVGPFPWNALDERAEREDHDADWERNVQPYLLPSSHTSYWRYHPDMSAFSENFE